DDMMRFHHGDDYAIACCVSSMRVGKEMQFFGARANLAKCLLYAINGGYDVSSDMHIGPQEGVMEGEELDFDVVMDRYQRYIAWLMRLYVNTMNIIHYMHDKYAYEKVQMALHDTEVERLMAFGVAGLSVVADSLSAIKFAKVRPIRNEKGYIESFETTGDFPKYGNDDDRVDLMAKDITHKVITELRKTPAYRDAIHTLSILTITSNVMYGKHTAATPDGRGAGEPFAPGANPMHNREENGALASLNSVAKISYDDCRDGVSNTFSITPNTLGATDEERYNNLVSILDGYFTKKAHHINVNVLNRETLLKAYENPEDYPNLTIRVSGYAVNFNKLSRQQQREVISRTFHESL
ncbi:MAG: formate acetyltransferase, partial [Clostridia bacterium]|nr:formate acetyltransferase [Clostridia bacterium]